VRFLIDECLHTSLIRVANEAGHEAHHVVYRAWAGLEDHELRAIILREEFVFATNDGRDFLELLAETELHPRLVIIVPNEKPPVQREMFRAALRTVTPLPSTVNKVIEVYSGEDVRIYDLPELK
jgi:predicted nuclease of predicted toxin-antitoxin system